jgi:RNA polymerase sigma-70 factor (ECF subfamily)
MSSDPSFTGLVDQFHGPLYRFAFRLTGREADACDLVQETFYIWIRKGSQLQEPAKAKAWLFTTLYREFLQARRRSTRFPEVEFNADAMDAVAVNPDAMAQLDGQTVSRLLENTDEVFRAPLVLFYLEEHSYEEISAILGVPLGTVKSRLSRGIAQMRDLLQKDFIKGGHSHD